MAHRLRTLNFPLGGKVVDNLICHYMLKKVVCEKVNILPVVLAQHFNKYAIKKALTCFGINFTNRTILA